MERRLTPDRMAARFDRSVELVATPALLKHTKARLAKASPEERARLAKSVRAMRRAVEQYEQLLDPTR